VKYLRWLVSLVAGMVVGIILHYTLYRIGLPVEPFIYLAF
jgi:xanthosine utilization system XapX-like protein